MFSVLRSIQSGVRVNVIPKRNVYVYVGRAREEVSIMELWGHGLCIAFGILATPCWVLCHIKEYRGIDKPKEE